MIGIRKLIQSTAGLATLITLAALKADPAYAWVVGIIVVPTAAALLGEHFAKGFSLSKRPETESIENRE